MKKIGISITLTTVLALMGLAGCAKTVAGDTETDDPVKVATEVVEVKQEVKNGWVKENSAWKFYSNDETQTGWVVDNGNDYFLNKDGVMHTGWLLEGGVWYYALPQGAIAKGWHNIANVWYYFNEKGYMLTGWQNIGGQYYKFNNKGNMLKNWHKDGGVWYHLGDNGGMKAKGWHKEGNSWYNFNYKGYMREGGWAKLNGKDYYFGKDGKMYANTTLKWGKDKYEFDNNGVAKKVVPAAPKAASSSAQYSLRQFSQAGVVFWGGYKFTWYEQVVLPGGGLVIPGRHVNANGYIADKDGYIVLASDKPKGTVIPTPFGAPGKVYDRGTTGNWLDVYIYQRQ